MNLTRAEFNLMANLAQAGLDKISQDAGIALSKLGAAVDKREAKEAKQADEQRLQSAG